MEWLFHDLSIKYCYFKDFCNYISNVVIFLEYFAMYYRALFGLGMFYVCFVI